MDSVYRKILNGCKPVKRTKEGISKQYKLRIETTEMYINRAINEGYLIRDKGSYKHVKQ